MTPPPRHPLAPIDAEEIRAARRIVFESGLVAIPTEHVRFAYVGLCDPSKSLVHAYDRGEEVVPDRRLRLVLLQGPEAEVVEATVSVTRGTVDSWVEVPEARPALQMEEAIGVLAALWDDPAWNAALDRRGIADKSLVQIDPWPAGNFALDHEKNRRITRALAYLRDSPGDNGYARPLEGLMAFVDMGRGVVLEVVDLGVVPIPPQGGSYYPEDNGPLRTDLRPLVISQPEGPSFEVEGNLVRWQRWSLRVVMDPLEGLVLYAIGYEDAGRVRPVLFRASVSEMVVPYGDPGPMHSWKSAFDAGEWGLGRMANSLTQGCDCLGEITYLDDVFSDERQAADPGQRHLHPRGGLRDPLEARRPALGSHRGAPSRRLVISSIATVGNYEYGFYWYFYLDGTLQFEVKLTGIMSTMAVPEGASPAHASMVAPGLAAPFHQHLFNVRLNMEVDGPHNTVIEVDTLPTPLGEGNPWGNAFAPVSTLLESELAARRDVDPSRSRSWKIVNRSTRNGVGQPTAYKLLPGYTPTMLADPSSSVGQRAAFASHNLWVTPFAESERYAAGDYPNQHSGGAGLPAWTAQDRSVVDTDIVVWHSFGVTHIPRPEDWPVMPVESSGFSLVPFGFFDRNPALDVPPSAAGEVHCHAE